ncbi:MAG: hypothetical protein H6718_09725 [Polyangiaceae bacterium]|nr:hypothetical protein [Myxococcales bacterium]MCB9585667.1 hypothetical protein [Polyangiaceae bacterium]MCB9607404.1 hypothetical protein [Polyangiaceae bacterium]
MAEDPSRDEDSAERPEQASSSTAESERSTKTASGTAAAELNPYAPPNLGELNQGGEDGSLAPRDARPFTTVAVGIATFLGSALAGTILMYLSLSRMGRAAEARRAALLGGGLTLGTLVAALVLPPGIGNVVPIAVTIGIVMLARQMLDPVVMPHLARGGSKGSGWLVAGVTVGSAVAVFGALIGLSEGLDISADDYVESAPGHRVVYERGATEGEARQVAEVLETNGVFPPGSKAEVVLQRKGTGLQLQVVLGSNWKDPSVISYYTALAGQLSTRTGRSPFEILLCNEFLLTKQKVSSLGP